MSHIIKLKDEHGNWIPVPTIKGEPGDAGRGIVSIARTSGTGAPGTVDTYTITYTDGTTDTYQVRNGADGSGVGDMTKYVYDTDNDGVVDVAEKLQTYITTVVEPANVNQWSKLGEITFIRGNCGYKAILAITTLGSYGGMGLLSIDVATSANLSESIRSEIVFLNRTIPLGNKYMDFKIVYTAPKYELYFVPSVVWNCYTVTVLSESCSDLTAKMTYYSNQPFQATQPAGTVVSASMLKLNNDISGTADGNVLLLPAATPANLPLVSDASRGMQTKTAAEMRAILGAQPTMTPGTDYAIPAVDITTTLSATWTGSAAPYTQTVSGLSGVTANSKLDIGLAETATDAQFTEAVAAQIRATGSGTGTVTFKAHGTKPTGDLPILIRMVD